MNNDKTYVSGTNVAKQYDISITTLRNWADSKKIRCLRPNENGRRLYNVEDLRKILGHTNLHETLRKTILYARVSSDHQKEDLERQIEYLKKDYPNADVIKDVASGLNWKRNGFKTLLEQVHKGLVSEVVVTCKDRLCRFGFELVEWIFEKNRVKLVVLNSMSGNTAESELAEDLMSIASIFVAKSNGLKSANYRRKRIEEQKNQNLPNKEAESSTS